MEGSGEQGGGISTRQGIQHTVGGIQASHTPEETQKAPNQLGGDTNSSEKLKTPHSLQRLLPNSTVFLPKRSVKMTGDEKAAAVEKSQLVPVEKSQEEEKKPNAAPTE